MHVLDATAVHANLPWPDLIEALRRAHLGSMPSIGQLLQEDPAGSGNQFVTLPGWAPGGAIAVKLVGVFPANRDLMPPRPSVQGLVAVFDGQTGAPRMVADGAAMTVRKTAGDSALGAAILARTGAKTLLVLGAGALAPHAAAAHCAARPSIRRVMIWNRTPAGAQAVAETLRAEGLDAESVTDLDRAVAQADVVSCVTMSDRPLVKGALLRPGAHLDLIGAYLPDMRETDDEAMRRGAIFVDTRSGIERAGDLAQAVENGAIGWDAVRADLFELVQGRASGRQSSDEITVFKNNGGAHLDLFTAAALLERLG